MPWYQQDGRTELGLVLQTTVSIRGATESACFYFIACLPFPFASAGAIEGHSEHNFDEQGMSRRK